MAYADRVKEVCTAAIGTGAITLAGAATGFQTFAAGFTVGATLPYCIVDASGNWETGIGTLTGATTLTRGVVKSSNGGSLINFGAGSKDVFCTPLASQLAALQVSQDIAFAAAIPLNVAGTQYMPQQTVSSVLAFTAAGSPVKGASVYVRLLADGTNAPTFTGMKEWGGSLGYDNRSLIANQIQFFFDGYDTWYSISQAVGAVATPAAVTGVTMTGPISGVASTASTNFSVGVTPVGGTITGTVVVTPSDASGGGTFAPTSVSLSSGAPTGTFTYTPNSTVTTRTISVTNNGSLTNPTSISYSVTAAATVPGAPTIGTATGGDASASVTFTAPASNGGATITGYTVTSSPGGFTGTGAASPITVSGLTNATAYTFTVKATNSVGQSAASGASNSVTPAAAAPSTVRMTGSKSGGVTESASAPWTYTDAGGATGTSGVMSATAVPSTTDCTVICKVNTVSGDFMFGVVPNSSAVASYTSTDSQHIWSNGVYKIFGNKGITTAVVPATGDLIRFKKLNSATRSDYLVDYEWAVSKDNGTTWTVVGTNDAGTNGMRLAPVYIHVQPGANAVLSITSAVGLP